MENNTYQDQVIGIPMINSAVRRPLMGYLPGPDGHYLPPLQQRKAKSMLKRMNKLGKKADNCANGVREHVRLWPKFTETVKGKLSLGAKILQVGGVERIFQRLVVVDEDEKLLKASQCYLSQQQVLLQACCLSPPKILRFVARDQSNSLLRKENMSESITR